MESASALAIPELPPGLTVTELSEVASQLENVIESFGEPSDAVSRATVARCQGWVIGVRQALAIVAAESEAGLAVMG